MTCGRVAHQPAPRPPSPGPALWCANQPALDQPEVYRCARAACGHRIKSPLERTHPACGTPASMPAITINCELDAREPPTRCRRSSLCHLPGVQNGARTVDDAQLGRALFAQPHHYPRRVRPEKWGNFSGNLHRVIALQALERLDKKHPVIGFAVRATVAMDAFAFEKELSLQWRPTFPSRRTARASSKRSGGKDPAELFLEEIKGRQSRRCRKFS